MCHRVICTTREHPSTYKVLQANMPRSLRKMGPVVASLVVTHLAYIIVDLEALLNGYCLIQ